MSGIRKTLALVLALVMALACGIPAATAEDAKTITINFFGGRGQQNAVQENYVYRQIKEKLGIEVFIDYSYTDEKFITMIATDSLMDLNFFYDPVISSVGFDQIIESGVVMPLDDLLAEYGQNILNYAGEMVEYSRTFESGGTGKVYFLNQLVCEASAYVEGLHIGPNVRWDYFKEIGAPVMTSDKDYVDAIAKMLENHPTNEEGLPNVGLSLWSDWANGRHSAMALTLKTLTRPIGPLPSRRAPTKS